MGRQKRTVHNYDLFSGFQFYTPGVSGMLTLLVLLLCGGCLGSFVTLAMAATLGQQASLDYGTLISYPVMFIPPMMYASLKSKRNSMWDTGYALDSNNFGRCGGLVLAILAALATLAAAYMTDAINAVMPKMPKWLEDALGSLTSEGNFVINFICVSVLAPLCEEWLCRGEILRGLLNSKKKSGQRTMSPAGAIVTSSLFFALIHLNPWQAIPAFILGCLFGYVYYRTGSLKLTMLMHCVNNTFSLVCSRIPAFEDADNWIDVTGPKWYWLIFAACALLLVLIIREFRRVDTQSPAGNCDEIRVAD